MGGRGVGLDHCFFYFISLPNIYNTYICSKTYRGKQERGKFYHEQKIKTCIAKNQKLSLANA